MIKREEIFEAGEIYKTHGVKGELSFSFTTDAFEDSKYFVCSIDGIFVPFFIESYRYKNSTTALVKFENIDNEKEAKLLVGCTLYLPNTFKKPKEEITSYSDFIDFVIMDSNKQKIGTIVDADDTTLNVLFSVANEKGDMFLIPVSEDYIVNVDAKKRIICMDLPEGLLDINKD